MVNDIEYSYDHDTARCRFMWLSVKSPGKRSTQTAARSSTNQPPCLDFQSRLHWIASMSAVTWGSLSLGIEISMLVEKRQGYHYEHAFSYDWNAMKDFILSCAWRIC